MTYHLFPDTGISKTWIDSTTHSLSPGFAGIPNPLFAMENAMMFFSDGKDAIQELITAVKENQ